MLELTDVTCGYGAFEAVRGLSLEVPDGGAVALVGANGAGKTSTVMAIAGHVRVSRGAIVYHGVDLARLPATARVRNGIAPVPEGRQLFADLSVEENLVVGGYTLSRADAARQRELVLELFPRLGERLRQVAGSLSGGEQQMLAIGRALMARPGLLLVDELSLGLMPAAVDVCYEALGRLRGMGLGVLLVEQSTARALAFADRVCVLESGRPVWQGSAEEARADPRLIEAYLGLAANDHGREA